MVKATMPSILNTVRNIFMKLYGSIEEVVTMCLVANYYFYAPEGTSGGILKSHRPSVRPSVTNRVSAISHKLLKQI